MNILKAAMLILVCCLCSLAQTGPADQLRQYVTDLQKAPDDAALREKIIKLAQTMTPKPAITDEARRHFVRASTYQKEGKSKEDFVTAMGEYRQALMIAPWWADAYFNEGVAAESAGEFDQAASLFKLYLTSGPNEADASLAKDKLYGIDVKREIAAREKEKARTPQGLWSSLEYDSGDGVTQQKVLDIRKAADKWQVTLYSKIECHNPKHPWCQPQAGPDPFTFVTKAVNISGPSVEVVVDIYLDGKLNETNKYSLTVTEDGQALSGSLTHSFQGRSDFRYLTFQRQ